MEPSSSTSASPSSALVIWGSTGARLQFTRQDLQMPESVKERSNYHFFEKQWDTIAGFWMNRVLKETALQYMTVNDIIQCIINDIERRWEQRKKEKMLYKKRKRLLDPKGTTAAGMPSQHVLLTNIVSLVAYRQHLEDGTLDDLLTAVLGKVEEVAREKVLKYTLLVDDGDEEINTSGSTWTNNNNNNNNNNKEDTHNGKNNGSDNDDVKSKEITEKHEEGQEQITKKRKMEDDTEVKFDDHVALVCTLSSEIKAASVIAELHGSLFDSRVVLCRFYAL